jgi:Zn-dependent protease
MSMDVVLALFEFVVMVMAISFHDAAQAWVASYKGDPTARMLGRITLNPVKHFDLFGTLIWPALFIFRSPLVLGWGKPLPITPRNFRHPDRDEMIVYLCGPLAHLIAAAACLILLLVFKHFTPGGADSLQVAAALSLRNMAVSTLDLPPLFPIVLFLYLGILVNLLLFVFNLLPLPSRPTAPSRPLTASASTSCSALWSSASASSSSFSFRCSSSSTDSSTLSNPLTLQYRATPSCNITY